MCVRVRTPLVRRRRARRAARVWGVVRVPLPACTHLGARDTSSVL